MQSIPELTEIVKSNMPHFGPCAEEAAELVQAGQVWSSTRGTEVVDRRGQQYTVKTGKQGSRCTCKARSVCVHRAAAWLLRAL